ncbi:MAG: glycoside hydrolase family 3 N-terminal domain-containing protein, partial [Gemmiger sp.]
PMRTILLCAGLVQWSGVLCFAAPLRRRSRYPARALAVGVAFQLLMLPAVVLRVHHLWLLWLLLYAGQTAALLFLTRLRLPGAAYGAVWSITLAQLTTEAGLLLGHGLRRLHWPVPVILALTMLSIAGLHALVSRTVGRSMPIDGLYTPGPRQYGSAVALINRKCHELKMQIAALEKLLPEGEARRTLDETRQAILAAKGYGDEAAAALTWHWTQDALDTTTYATSQNGTPITNQLSSADPNLNESCTEEVVWLSRSDWEGTFPKETVKLALTDALIADLQDVQYDPAGYEPQTMPRLGANNGLTLFDMIGKDYDDPDWDKLLDQLTFDEMVSLIGDSFHWRMPAISVQAPGTRDENGPQGLTASLLGSDKTQLASTAFTSEDVMAATFNTDLMYEIGKVIGNNCLQADIVCLYGPGNNIHRTPYGGRNFEYYSEDGFLSGKMSAAEVKGIEDKGVNVVMKHFALNDCEQDRIGLGVWVNEQAAREIYLKAFQAPFEEGGANGVMTAYTRWGTQWSGGHKGLMTGIMREEWGNNGFSITDNVLTTYVNGVDGVLAGVTTFDAMLPHVTNQLPQYENDAVIVNAMREACHHNLYALANSSGMNGIGANTTIQTTRPTVVTMAQIIACAASFFFLLFLVLWILGVRKFRKTEGYRNWKAFRQEQKAAKKA